MVGVPLSDAGLNCWEKWRETGPVPLRPLVAFALVNATLFDR